MWLMTKARPFGSLRQSFWSFETILLTILFHFIKCIYFLSYFSEVEIIEKISFRNVIAYNFAIKTAHQSALQTEEWLKMRDKCLAICKTILSSKLESPCFALPDLLHLHLVYIPPPKCIFSLPHLSNIMLNDDARMHLQGWACNQFNFQDSDPNCRKWTKFRAVVDLKVYKYVVERKKKK